MSVVIERVTADIMNEISEGGYRPGEAMLAPADLAWTHDCTEAEAEEVLRILEVTFYIERAEGGCRVRKNPGADPELIRPRGRRPRRY